MNLDSYAFSKQPGFVETEMRKVFKQAVPLRTVVIYCYDPRAVNIPHAVAKAMPGEVYPRRNCLGRARQEGRVDDHDLPGCSRWWTCRGRAPFHHGRSASVWNREHRCGAPHV